MTLFLTGSLVSMYHNYSNLELDHSKHTKWIGTVQRVIEKDEAIEAIIHVEYLDSTSSKNTFMVAAKLQSDQRLLAGDRIAAESNFYPFKPPILPHAFDYRSLMHQRKIYFQTYLKEWKHIAHVNTLNHYSEKMRKMARAKYAELDIDGENFKVLNALILGDKSHLDEVTKAQFSKAGVMHILAVSGLHVGIIFLILKLGFKRLNKYAWGRWLRLLMTIICLWAFALMTGLSPSVQRAAFMFSIICIGEALNRTHHSLNSIFGSALLLLVFNPNLLYELGFQLSYLAVLAIVTVFPFLRKQFYVKHKVLQYMIEVMLISVIAQLATMALGMYHFHQFPNLFLLFNLLVIPLTFIIVSFAILVMVIANLPILSAMMAKVLDASLTLLNSIVSLSDGISFSSTSDIYLDGIEFILLLSICGLILIYLGGFLKKGLMMALILLFILLIYDSCGIYLHSSSLSSHVKCIDDQEYLLLTHSKQAAIKKETKDAKYISKVIEIELKHIGYNHILSD